MTSYMHRATHRVTYRFLACAGFPGVLVLLSLLVPALPASAQQPVVVDTMYLHAHALVSRGQGAEGRALVDSLLLATPPATPAYAEGLFWRAVTASRAEDAERDYLRIVIEFPLSPRSEDALIRLAELEMMRGDRTRAQRHLQRLIIEHPNGAGRARASYWLARVFFDANDLPRACNELNVARARAATNDIELRNQVDYQAQRCVGVNVVVAPTPAPAISQPASTVAAAAPPASAPAATSPTTPAGTSAATPPVAPPAPRPVSMSPPVVPAGTSETPRRAGPEFTVQVAAFPTRAAADRFMETLQAKGYDVRVWGTEYPFRVRIGRFATRAEAATIAQELRTRMISKDAFVAEAEVR